MAQVSTGDTTAFGELYDRYGDRAYSIAVAVCRDDHRAEAVVQAVFGSLWRHRDSYRPERGTVAAWLLTSVRSQAAERVRQDMGTGDGDRTRSGSGAARATPRAPERLEDLLARLPDPEQEVIALACFGQLSHSDIAAYLGLDADTVKHRMRVGLHQLQESLTQSQA